MVRQSPAHGEQGVISPPESLSPTALDPAGTLKGRVMPERTLWAIHFLGSISQRVEVVLELRPVVRPKTNVLPEIQQVFLARRGAETALQDH